jgi:hypothetical protein
MWTYIRLPKKRKAAEHIWEHQGSYSVHICICPLQFWLPTSWVILLIFSTFFEPPLPFRNPLFAHSAFTISETLISLTPHYRFYQSWHKTWCSSAAPDPWHFFSDNSVPRSLTTSCVAWERTTHLVCSSWKRKLEQSKRVWVHELAWVNIPATQCGRSGN